MSIITIQLGQCGNQVGRELFDALSTDLHSTHGLCSRNENQSFQMACKERFFSEEEFGKGKVPAARAVLVDMEPKVIGQTLTTASKSGHWKYAHQSHFSQKQGSGNNWASGYCVHGPKHKDVIMNLVQKEAEKCDRLSGFLTVMSMAGGTGSGLGTFVTESLQDAYPASFLLNHVIWPYGTGEIPLRLDQEGPILSAGAHTLPAYFCPEQNSFRPQVIVQNYNSVLTLSHLYQSSNALLVHENDTVHKICAQLMKIKQISFQDVNQVIAHQLGSIFQPAYSCEGAAQYSRNPLGDLMEALVPHPEFKMLGLRNIPQMSEDSLRYSTFAWPGLLKHLRQMLIANAKMEEEETPTQEEAFLCRDSWLLGWAYGLAHCRRFFLEIKVEIVVGLLYGTEGIDWQVRPPLPGLPPAQKHSPNQAVRFNTSIANLVVLRGKDVQSADLGGFRDPALYTSWLNASDALAIWKTPRAFNKYEKSVSLVSNSQFLLKPIDSIVGKAWKMFASKAYVHQYTKFGIEEEAFLDCFTALEQVIASYSSL